MVWNRLSVEHCGLKQTKSVQEVQYMNNISAYSFVKNNIYAENPPYYMNSDPILVLSAYYT